MLQLDNTSPFEVEMLGFPDVEGVDTLLVAIKATFGLGPRGVELAEEQQPVTLADEYWGEPGASSLRWASEAHLPKPGTDVLVMGDACAPGGRPCAFVDVSVAVAGRTKSARVHGDRHWTEGLGGLRPSRARPFVQIPVVYERAFGGRHAPDPASDEALAEPRNPVGCGFAGKRSVRELLGQPVPNVEDLRAPVTAPGSRGTPVGFGPIAPSWSPRAGWAGTYDEAWERSRAPYLPRDFDPRFFHVASAGLVFDRPLRGGEGVAMLGFHPGGVLRFGLPCCELGVVVTVAGEAKPLGVTLETVALEPTAERFTMTWRGALPVDKRMLAVERVAVSLERAQGVVGEGIGV